MKISTVLLISFLILVVWFSIQPVNNFDIWWLLASGRYYAENGITTPVDVFSFTHNNYHWLHHEWIPSLVFYFLHNTGGMTFLWIFKSLAVLGMMGLGILWAYKRNAGLLAVSIAGIWMAAISFGLHLLKARAFLFGYFFIMAALILLGEAYFGKETSKFKRFAIFLLIPLTILWVNSHGSFIVMFLLQLIFIICAIVRKDMKMAKTGAYVFIGSIIVSMLNPSGYKLLLFPIDCLDNVFLHRITEFEPPDYFGDNLFFTLSVGIVILSAALLRKKLRPSDFMIIILFSYFGLSAIRHTILYSTAIFPIFAVILTVGYNSLRNSPIEGGEGGCPGELGIRNSELRISNDELLIPNSQFVIPNSPGHPPSPPSRGEFRSPHSRRGFRVSAATEKYIAIVILVIVIIFSYFKFSTYNYRVMDREGEIFPVYGVEFLKMNDIPGPVFNFYGWGGYLMWKLYPDHKVFVDGRANTAYPETVYTDYLKASMLQDGWHDVLDKYNINIIFFHKWPQRDMIRTFVDALEKDDRWVLIFDDNVEKIFIRNSPENADLISRAASGNLKRPLSPYLIMRKANYHLQQGDLASAEATANEALKLSDRFIPAMATIAYIRMQQGKLDEAIETYNRALSFNPIYRGLNYSLGYAYEMKGDIKKAAWYYRAELKENPDFLPARNRLKEGNDF